jgi:hypothetical protein
LKHCKPQVRSRDLTPIKENDYSVDDTTITATLLNTFGVNNDNKNTNQNNEEISISKILKRVKRKRMMDWLLELLLAYHHLLQRILCMQKTGNKNYF